MSNVKSTFEAPGSIEPPGIIGRIVRLLLGFICLDLFVQIVDDISGMIERGWPLNFASIFTVFLGFFLLKPVINIGFTAKLKYIPQIIVGSITITILAFQWVNDLPLFDKAFTAFLMSWMSYVYGHLGLSFVVAAVIRTPGCEMRSLPHLWSKLSGKESVVHYCPGPLTPIDNWERKFKSSTNGK